MMYIDYEMRISEYPSRRADNAMELLNRDTGKPAKKADKSAVCAINRHLLMFGLFCSSALIRQGKRNEQST